MGYGVMAYAVDIDKLTVLCGSGDNQVRRAVCGRFRADISRTNDEFDLPNDRGAANLFTAVEHLIMGEEMDLDGYLYGYAFKYIVEFSGRMLTNNGFYPCPSQYISETVDPAIKETGANLSVSDLIFRGPPVPFPRPDDFPAIGYWTAGEVAANVTALAAGISGPDVLEQVHTVASWTTYASSRSHGIVGFYH